MGGVIDLGLEREAPEGRSRGGWRARSLVPLLAVVLLLAVAGSAPWPGPTLVERATHPLAESADFAVLGDRLFAVAEAGTIADERVLNAYELPSGRLLWSGRYRSGVDQFVDLQRGDGVVLVTGLQVGDGYGTPTTVLDAATGQPRWTAPTRLTVADDGRTGFVGGATVRGIDLATGRDLWADATPDGGTVRALPGGRVLVLTGTGEGQLRDGRTGTVRRTATMLPAGAVPGVSTSAGGDAFVLTYQEPGDRGRQIAGFAVNTLSRRWARPLADEDAPRFGACGSLVCTAGPVGVVAVDPATGAPVWDAGQTDTVFESGGSLVAARWPDRLAVLDPASGRTLVDLSGYDMELRARGDTALVGVARTGDGTRAEAGSQPVAGTQAGAGSRAEEGDRSSGGDRSWLALVGARTGQIRHLGVVPDRLWDCAAGAASVVCRAPGDRLRVWAYRR
ncbi:hypothetical protein WEI85_09805 [Actinomycetes bacterium KLBMP 9797]